MLPFAQLLAPGPGATFLAATGAMRANSPTPLRQQGVRPGHLGVLIAEHGWGFTGGWTNCGDIAVGRTLSVQYKILTSQDLDYSAVTQNDFCVLCYADARSAVLVTPAGFRKAPGYAGLITVNTQVPNTTVRFYLGYASQAGDPRPYTEFRDLVAPQLPYADGTAFQPASGGVIQLRA